jgi:hypothetical protein
MLTMLTQETVDGERRFSQMSPEFADASRKQNHCR